MTPENAKQIIDDVTLVLKSDAKEYMAGIGRARAYAALGDFQNAANDWSLILSHRPAHLSIRLERGLCLYSARLYDDSIADFTAVARAQSAKPEQVLTARMNRGMALETKAKDMHTKNVGPVSPALNATLRSLYTDAVDDFKYVNECGTPDRKLVAQTRLLKVEARLTNLSNAARPPPTPTQRTTAQRNRSGTPR